MTVKEVNVSRINAALNNAAPFEEVRQALYTLPDSGEQPVMVVVSGRSGSGKTTVASRLADDMGAIHMSSDARRKAMYDCPIDERLDSECYSDPDCIEDHRENMEDEITEAIYAGQSVVVDAAACSYKAREEFEELAERSGAKFVGVMLDVSPEVARGRVAERGIGASDMDVYEFDRQEERRADFLERNNERARARGWVEKKDIVLPSDNEKNWHVVDGTDRPQAVYGQVLTKVEIALEVELVPMAENEPELERA